MKKARELASMRATRAKAEEQSHVQKVTLDNIFEKIEEGEMKELNLIIKADVQGSAEALLQSFAGIKSEKVRISIVHSAVGAINESDVMLASASNALILASMSALMPTPESLLKQKKWIFVSTGLFTMLLMM